jgi:hypothetical protein
MLFFYQYTFSGVWLVNYRKFTKFSTEFSAAIRITSSNFFLYIIYTSRTPLSAAFVEANWIFQYCCFRESTARPPAPKIRIIPLRRGVISENHAGPNAYFNLSLLQLRFVYLI